jgi:esterase/lipase superfamily enzyme
MLGLACLVLLAFSGCSGTGAGSGPGRSVAVYYATNRVMVDNASLAKTFGNTAADNQVVTYGKAEIGIPSGHKIGGSQGVAITGYSPKSMDSADFFKAINPAGLNAPPRDLFVFVHGFNNSFSVAACRAGVFANDLQPNSAPFGVIYSWPSAESVFAYEKDEDSVQLNQPNLRRFLSNIHTRTKAGRTVLIGHSMGCRALTFALRDYFFEQVMSHGAHVQPSFDELIFIEPDVTDEYFTQNLIGAKALCRHITIYTESHDLALKASHILHQYQSLGLSMASLGKDVDVIDATAAKNDFIGHSYDGPAFFSDLGPAMRGVPAAQRASLSAENGIYKLKGP